MILGVSGSPRNGATEHVLRHALGKLEEAGHETAYWSVRGKKIGFCIHCDHCLKGDGCVYRDLDDLYSLMREADSYILATPVYNGCVSGQLKTVIDRTRALFASDNKALRYKPGASIAIGGNRAGGQELALQQINNYYTMSRGIPVSGGFFGANLGASFWSKDSLEGVKRDEEGFKSLDKTIKRLIKFIEEHI